MDNYQRCMVCGAMVPGNAYCANCGADLKHPERKVWSNCVNCGNPVHVTYPACRRCGAANLPPVQARTMQSESKKKRSGARALLLVIPLLLLLAGIGVGLMDYLENAFGQTQYPGTTGSLWQPETTQAPAATKDPAAIIPPQTQATTTAPAAQPTQPAQTQPTQPAQTQPTAKPTEPTPTEPTPTEPVSNIPVEYEGNYYLRGVGDGYCETMTGEVLVIFLFVSDPTDGWTEAERAEAEPALLDELRTLLAEAQGYGVELNLHYLFLSTSIATEFDSDWDALDWKKEAMVNAGLEAGYNDQRTLEAKYEMDQVPVVFLVDEPGRSFAHSYTSGSGFENVTILDKDYTALRHEICHVFGAKDMYFPQETVQAAKQYLPNGIMYGDCTGDIDPLTAFTIGWTDTLSDNARAFLDATNSLTEAYIEEAKAQDKLTGYGTKYYDDGDYYTGDLVNGVRHGQGTYYFVDGAIFTGTWVNGERTGYGVYVSPDGYRYEGDWVENVRHGKGKETYADGGVYSGALVDGERHGQGTYTWPSGAVYSGNWENGSRTGYGEYVGNNGFSYKGYWKDSKYHGNGTVVYEGGDTYTGDFASGLRHGKGTYTWSDGSVYTGDWVEGKRTGEGKLTWKNGSYYIGDFVDGAMTGYGERYYADYGTRYVGDFVNGKRHGYGTFYYADGSVYEGRWENGVRAD